MKKSLLATLLAVAAFAASTEAMAYVSVGVAVGSRAYVPPVYVAPVTPMVSYVAPYTAVPVTTTTVVSAPGTVVYSDPYVEYGSPVAVAPLGAAVVVGGHYGYGHHYGGYGYRAPYGGGYGYRRYH
jgi:hypothetical protein